MNSGHCGHRIECLCQCLPPTNRIRLVNHELKLFALKPSLRHLLTGGSTVNLSSAASRLRRRNDEVLLCCSLFCPLRRFVCPVAPPSAADDGGGLKWNRREVRPMYHRLPALITDQRPFISTGQWSSPKEEQQGARPPPRAIAADGSFLMTPSDI